MSWVDMEPRARGPYGLVTHGIVFLDRMTSMQSLTTTENYARFHASGLARRDEVAHAENGVPIT